MAQNRKLTQDEIEKIFERLEILDANVDYHPTVESLKKRNVDERFDEEFMPEFLLWIQESLPAQMSEEEKAVNTYITEIFKKHGM